MRRLISGALGALEPSWQDVFAAGSTACGGMDHAVMVVHDLEQIARDFDNIGLRVVHRPSKPGSAQRNSYTYFADGSYLQFCNFPDDSSVHPWAELLSTGNCWADYSLRTTKIGELSALIRGMGLPSEGPSSISGAHNEGEAWHVEVLKLGRGVAGGLSALPFLVQDISARSLRVPKDQSDENVGLRGIAGVTVAVGDLASVAKIIRHLSHRAQPFKSRYGSGATILYEIGSMWLELIETDGSADLCSHVNRFGPGVFEVTIGRPGVTGPGVGNLVNLQSVHGVRLRIDSTVL